MLKWKYKKILAGLMAGSLLMQTFSEPVMAGESSDSEAVSVMSQAESEDFSQGSTVSDDSGQSNTEEGNTNSDAPDQSNTDADDSDQADVEITDPDQDDMDQADIEITDTDEDTQGDLFSDTDQADLNDGSTSEEIDIKSTEELIKLSNENAANYQNKTITITRNTTEALDLTTTTEDGKTFQGLGSEDNPFMGTLKITNADTSTIDILINHSFFNYLDQSASIGSGLYLKTRGQNQISLLAEHFVNRNASAESAEGSNISLTVEATAENDDKDMKAGFGGIIGTMDANTNLALTVKNNTADNVNLTVSGTGNVGFFCNTMETGAALTITSYTDKNSSNEIKYPVAGTNGNAGGLVGEMKADASLTVASALNLTGDVTAAGDGAAAGGLVGLAEDAVVTLKETVTRSGSVQGASESGGCIGKTTYTKLKEINLENFTAQDLTLGDCKHAGGVFGVLNYGGSDTLKIENAKVAGVAQTGSCWQFGGIIGQYSASSQNSILHLEGPNVNITGNGSVTAAGGIIGSMAGAGAADAIGNATQAYVEISNATVNTQLTNDLSGEGCCFGGLVAELGNQGDQGHFLSVSGTTTIKGFDNGKAPSIGGILGKASNGVLRLDGITDLSGFTIGRTGTECGQIAGTIDGTIVYARGTGNGNGGDGYDWKFIRPASAAVSDVGSYGEVIRLDGSSLKESDGSSDAALFNYDATSHKLTVAYEPNGNPTISSKRDLVALAILIQRNRTSGLLNQNITVDDRLSGQTLDLSGTGIVSLLRDNGSQTYTGTFEGNNCTVKMAAGEAYGYMSNGSTPAVNSDGNSATVGIGQIYNHSTIGFLPYCNGTVQNLTLDGFIYFQNVSGGTDVRCGAAAGYTDGATFSKVTAKTQIVYRDGLGGDGLKVMSIGGLIGRAKGTVTFKDCSMQGSISSTSGCHDFAIGGYLAAGDNNGDSGANVIFENCTILNAKIQHTKFTDASSAPNASFGGLIGWMNGSVTVKGLTIDGLSMSSYAFQTAGGLLGYYWRRQSDSDKVAINGLSVKNSSLEVNGTFGGLVYGTDEYWQIGDGTGEDASDGTPNGIRFVKDEDKANTFKGKTDAGNPSALLICSTTREQDTSSQKYAKAYVEIRKNGLDIQKDAVSVTLDGGDCFDDIAGRTKYGSDGYNAVLSIGLTALDAKEPELIDQKECNTWTNQCTVNESKNYTNKNTRYYYNVDYYRKQVEGIEVTDIDTPGKLLLRSLYVYAKDNLKQYFVKGSDDLKLTGNIDLSGVSYYPMSRVLNIANATVTFDYSNMNHNMEGHKDYSNSNLQHYQMQTGLFSRTAQKFSVANLTLKGTFGKYETDKAGVLICDMITQENPSETQAGITITNLTLDGIQCKYDDGDTTKLPLLINSVGSNTAISMNGVTYTREKGSKTPVGSALMGEVGSETAQKVSLEFANMDLNRKNENSLFTTAVFATSFQYADGASGGAYNFEKDAKKVTFGREISNGVNSQIKHNRNSYNKDNTTGQVWYVDTFGNTEAESYVGEDGPADSPQDFSKYLPYIGQPENAKQHYYEIDVNQKVVYLVDGCGTYGHPWVIEDVSRAGESQRTLFTGEDQMITVMKLLDETANNGVALKISKTMLKQKLKGQTGDISTLNLHSGDNADDIVVVKNGDSWIEAEISADGNRYNAKTGGDTYTNEKILAYLRNGYFYIKKDLTLDVAKFTGFGGNDVSHAFSGVIVGDSAERKVTLTGENKTGTVGGLIRYSQGSVVKNLKINFDNVTFTGSSTDSFFGGVIGWVIGGDNIIDNVTLETHSINKSDSAENLTAVGGYVGLVGGYAKDNLDTTNLKKGGGVVFRNISSDGLTQISGMATTTEAGDSSTDGGNKYYYWNPYVGRVMDGYACAEENCKSAMNNTDKNYTIPKLNSTDKLKITGHTQAGARINSEWIPFYSNSTITIDSSQAIWLLSAIVNSGFGAKSVSSNYGGTDTSMLDYASYYGRTRTGTYDDVGNAAKIGSADQTDERDYWGGKFENVSETGEDSVSHRKHSVSYLSTYINSGNVSASAVMYSLAADVSRSDDNVGGRSIIFEKGTYDLSGYGNGFRGIGYNYEVPSSNRKARALRLRDQKDDGRIAMQGNNATIVYKRVINEYSPNDIYVCQAGFFNQCLAHSSVTYTVENLHFQDSEVKKNITGNNIALGIVFARDAAYSPKNLNFKNVTVAGNQNTLEQADQGAALFGYMSEKTKNISMTFENCKVENFTAGISDENQNITQKMNHCGAFVGKAEKPGSEAESTTRTVKFINCTAKNINLYNIQNGGMFAGYINGPCEITGGSAVKGMIISRTKGDGGYSMGGLIGKTDSSLTVKKTENSQVTVSAIKINGSKDVGNRDSYAGGLAGYAASADISDVTVDTAKIAGKNLGGVIGGVGRASMQNVTVKNSRLANCKDKSGYGKLNVGGLAGTVTGSLNGFNILSKDNITGYLIKENSVQSGGFNSTDFDTLSENNIGLRLSTGNYISYASLANDASLKVRGADSPCGIWAGNANSNDVKLVSVSRQGTYSAVKNIGSGKTDSSCVIYADYTGSAAEDSSKISTKPDAVITVGSTALTGDGAAMDIRDTIINDTVTTPSLMKGHYGADENRSLDAVVKQFGTGGDYRSRLSNYSAEDTVYTGADFPVLILNAATKNELNSIVDGYISMLTNDAETQKKHDYSSITSTTYRYTGSAWTAVSEDEQTMDWSKSDGIKINRGKYDNNKNQITVLDVSYTSPVNNKEIYHLYVPILVKKLMDVDCSVQIVNGATGYLPDNIGDEATLNSFGENYTAQISYTYKWTVSEWQSMLENGDSLLWNFDKTVQAGEFGTLNRDKIHLTLVDMNTHGTQSSYYQSTLKDLENDGAATNDTLSLKALAEKGHAPYLCDLLPLEAKEDANGTFKEVDAKDKSAVLRIWDKDKNKFIYYAPKTANDTAGTYYAVTLSGKYDSGDILPVTEQYYLVMNSTEGDEKTPMINTKVELNSTYTDSQIPTRVTGTLSRNYILGDFYKISDISLESKSKNDSTEMVSGSNDTIKVKVSSQVNATVSGKTAEDFAKYVNDRFIYYQYVIQMVDQDGKPVDMKGAVSIPSLKLEKKDANGNVTETQTLTPLDDLNGGAGFTTQFGENGCYITIKAKGSQYTGAEITAEMNFSYTSEELNGQFPAQQTFSDGKKKGVQFKASAVMAYQQDSIGSSCITAATEAENKLYYRRNESQAKLSYDSYNISSKDGNTSQLGINGRENNDQPMEIKSRALFDASTVSGLNLTNASDEQYPYYLEGELTLAQKTETPVTDPPVIGKEYKQVSIGSYLSDFEVNCGNVQADTTSEGLGLQNNGSVFKFRIKLTQAQVSEIMNTPILVDITYKVKTGEELVKIGGGQYANYKVTLSATLENQQGTDLLTNNASDYLVYTNAKVYRGIVGANQ